jgi:hypothetical protein
MTALKKMDELKKMKKVNETLKRLMKPVKMVTRSSMKYITSDRTDSRASVYI